MADHGRPQPQTVSKPVENYLNMTAPPHGRQHGNRVGETSDPTRSARLSTIAAVLWNKATTSRDLGGVRNRPLARLGTGISVLAGNGSASVASPVGVRAHR